MIKRAKRVLVSGYIGFGNFGDEIIFSCLVAYLKSKGVKVSALSGDPATTARNHSVKAYGYKSILEILFGILTCDVLFSGGGSLLQNNTSDRSLNYYLAIINIAKMLGKPVVIFAQGLEGVSGVKQVTKTIKVLSKCDLVTVRDEISKKILDTWGIKSKLLCDPIYSLKLPPYNPQGYVGIQLRKSSMMNPLFLERLSDGVVKYFKGKKIKIYPFEEKADMGICVEFGDLLKRKKRGMEVEVVKNTSIHNIIREFATLEYLIAMRYHACILGSMYGIKTMPIIYDEKVLNMAKRTNMPYIDCSFEKDITNDFKNIEGTRTPMRQKFEWNVFEKMIR